MTDRILNIVILQKSRSLPANLRETLRQQGFSSHTVFDIDSALQLLRELPYALLLADCGENRQVAAQTIKHLVDTPDICDYPALLVAPPLEGVREALDRYFMLVRSVEAPAGITQVMEALMWLGREYPEYLKRLAKIAPQKIRLVRPADQTTTTPLSGLEPQLGPINIATRLIADLRDLAEQIGELGGERYGSRINEALLIEHGCYPEEPAARAAGSSG